MNFASGSKTVGRIYAECIMDFENRIRLDFKNSGQKRVVDIGVEVEFPDLGLEDGYMVVTNDEILACFDPVINRILELVGDQITAVQSKNKVLQVCTSCLLDIYLTIFQCILVSGTFAKSDYLFEKIKMHCPPQFMSKVIRPNDPSNASVQGAVIAAQQMDSTIINPWWCVSSSLTRPKRVLVAARKM